LTIVGLIAAAIFVILHVEDKIVDALEPAAHWMYKYDLIRFISSHPTERFL
jgi:hypothetical protein